MNQQVDKLRKFRLFVLKQISGLTSEQLNFIPPGYNNNIIWNMVHLVATTQALCYKRAGLPATISEKYIGPFLPGTKPDHFISEEEIAEVKELLVTTLDTLEIDLARNIFGKYTPSERIKEVYGIDIFTIEDAIAFLLYHDGFHSGYIISLIRLI
ncbi:MAG: DinB family protein [Cytophagaceae bacterium]|jgi:hypothetical protein|nr:DinB family protein [Cytophagaceae bacterium]